MKLDSLTFRIIHGASAGYGPAWSDGTPICDDFSRLYFLTEGSARVWWNEEEHLLRPGQLYLFPAMHTFRYHCAKSMHLQWVHFNIELIPGVDIFSRFKPVCERAAPKDASRLMMHMIASCNCDTPQNRLAGIAALADIMTHFFPEQWETILPPHGAFNQLAPLLLQISSNPAKDWTLKAIASHMHLSPTYCSNLFSRAMGVTPIRFVVQCRLRMARGLLLTTEKSVADIAEACGFRDAFYFSRIFGKQVGCTPTSFRQSRGLHP